jgi:PAS domain-containing protein
VYDLSDGKTESGFCNLDAFGAVHEVEDPGKSEKFRALFEGTSQAVFLCDEKGILEANPSLVRLLGYSRQDDLIGKHAIELSASIQPGGEPAEVLHRSPRASLFAPNAFGAWEAHSHKIPPRFNPSRERTLTNPVENRAPKGRGWLSRIRFAKY